ncbi:MAG TPA: methylamine utilization protein MauJ [Terracidiphilus sp.]
MDKVAEIQNQQPDAKINIPRIGFPGEPYSLVLTNIYKEPSAHLNAAPPWGLPGLYQVTLVLGKPGARAFPENEVRFADFMEGSSHLAILAPAFPAPADAVKIALAVKGETDSFVFEGWPDKEGYLAKLQTKPFQAQNRNDAEIRATKAAQGVLSEYAANLDIPLQIDLIEVTETATSNKSLTLIAPFQGSGSSAPIEDYDPEFANLAALYREALISNTPAYRFLCFYKILEASRKRRELLSRKLKKEYRPVRFGEVIPTTHTEQLAWLKAIFVGPREWKELTLNQIFPMEFRGKKLTALFDGPLRQMRDRIAHGILDSGTYLLLDDLTSTREITKLLPFLRCAVRRTLKNDFQKHYLPFLNEDGVVTYDYISKSYNK